MLMCIEHAEIAVSRVTQTQSCMHLQIIRLVLQNLQPIIHRRHSRTHTSAFSFSHSSVVTSISSCQGRLQGYNRLLCRMITSSDKPSSSITWSGSLVGSSNPNQTFGYTSYSYSKRHKTDANSTDVPSSSGESHDLPSSIIIQFQNRQGETVGSPMDVPLAHSSVDDLTSLIHTLLQSNDESDFPNNTPYAFYVQKTKRIGTDTWEEPTEITSSLTQYVSQQLKEDGGSITEQVLTIVFQPLAIFRVRPVTRCSNTITGHTEAVLHVSYCPRGKILASGGGDTTVRFWDVNTCLPIYCGKEHTQPVLSTMWSPDGKLFVSGDQGGNVLIWDPFKKKTATQIVPVDKDSDEPKEDTTTSNKNPKQPSTSSPSLLVGRIKAHSKHITSMAFEPMHRIHHLRLSNSGIKYSCERFVTASKDGLAKIWNIRTKQCEATLSGHLEGIECVKWGGDGLIYTASRDRTIKVWNADPVPSAKDVGKLVKTLQGHGHRVNTLALSTDYLCRTGPFYPNSKFIATSLTEANHEEACKVAYDHYREQTGGETERLMSGSDDFTLFLWNPKESKHPIKRLTGHQNLVNHINFSPDGRYVASAAFDSKIKLWNGKSGEFITTLHGHVGAVYQVTWSADSRYLVSASKDSTAKLWEMASLKNAKETLPGHADEVYALDWSPLGNSVATGSKDRTIKIWKH